MSLKLILVQLNEINFDLVNKYLSTAKKNRFVNLRFVKNTYESFNTYAENKYENLEPWIQWASVYLGQNFKQHKIFRLGDIVYNPKKKQIFEIIEEKGFKVGALLPMNAENRLKNPSYFIPDPWTETHSDESSFSKSISLMLKQTVNNNAQGNLSFSSFLTIIEIILRTIDYKMTPYLIKLTSSVLSVLNVGDSAEPPILTVPTPPNSFIVCVSVGFTGKTAGIGLPSFGSPLL